VPVAAISVAVLVRAIAGPFCEIPELAGISGPCSFEPTGSHRYSSASAIGTASSVPPL
jgi:hypothetical protein